MKHKTENNVRLVSLQSPVDGVRNGFNCYVYGRLFWEPDMDIETVRREYAEKMFPSAKNEFYNLHRHLSLAGMKQEDLKLRKAFAADLLLRMYDKVKDDPEQLLRWRTYGAWFEILTYPDSFGYTGDMGKPQTEIKKNAQRFISALKASAELEPLQIGVRICHHRSIVRKYCDKDLMGHDIPDIESELSYTPEGILAWLKKYTADNPLPASRIESFPFPEP